MTQPSGRVTDTPLDGLDWPKRRLLEFKNNGFVTVGDILQFSRADLDSYKCMDEKDIIDVAAELARLGVGLPEESAEWVREAMRTHLERDGLLREGLKRRQRQPRAEAAGWGSSEITRV